MLTILNVIFIHSAFCGEIAEGSEPPSASHQSDQPFSLRGGKTIVIKKFEFSGNSGISTAQLERLTSHYINRPLSESNLVEIKLRIEILYRSKGYAHAEVAISPKQKEGTLTFVIKEGKRQT